MSVDERRIQEHLDDYEQVTGKSTELFVCPITLRECTPSELIDGHILNARFSEASRRRTVQYGKVDHFYGSRVEPDLVHFLNMNVKTGADRLRGRKLRVSWPDGSEAEAFLADSRSGRKADGHFPQITVPIDGESVPLCLKIEHGDPRATVQPVDVVAPFSFLRSHWVAAMMKAAHLAMFDMIGYRSIFDPLGDTLRRTLAQLCEEDGEKSDAHSCFRDFRNAIKILGIGEKPEDLRRDYRAFEFDTLDDRVVFLHFTRSEILFAATCIFKINGASICVTLPHSMPAIPPSLPDENVLIAWTLYSRLMEDESSVDQTVHRAQFKGDHWEMTEKRELVQYVRSPDG